jgi:Fe-S-cluster containining protein
MSSDRPDPHELFQCLKCGDCCQGFGGTVISPGDAAAIVEFTGIDADRFAADYCASSGDRTLLRQGPDGYCIFWKKICTIHPVKPRLCRQWPFIESVLIDPQNWLVMAGACPGMRTDFPLESVQACVRQIIGTWK